MLTPDGTAKLLDLGLAVLSGESDPPPGAAHQRPAPGMGEPVTEAGGTLTHTGHALGTRDYMAPEQKSAPQSVGPVADVYGLGATLWFLLSGHPPAGSEPLAPSGAHGLPAAVWLGLLNPDPAARFASAEDAARALAPFARPPRRFRVRSTIGVALTLVAVACAAWLVPARERPVAPAPPSATPPVGALPFDAARAKELQAEWSCATGLPVRAPGPHGVELALVPPGAFGLSTECRVRLTKPYYLGTREITVGQFRAFVAETKYVTSAASTGRGGFHLRPDFKPTGGRAEHLSNPKWNWENTGHYQTSAAHPVCMVSWDDARAFCAWLGAGYRLPTETELTWAMRCGDPSDEPQFHLGERGWHRANATQPQPVGTLEASAWGLYDTYGNVAEWCADRAAKFPPGTFDDYAGPTDPALTRRVFVGYSYLTPVFKAKPLRDQGEPSVSFAHVGFRVARTPVP